MKDSYEQINEASFREMSKTRDEHQAWVMKHEHLITHAVTLTFDIQLLRRTLKKWDCSETLNHTEVLTLFQKSMRNFKWKLDKSLYGNRRGRIFFVPILEGLRYGEKPHYHCHLGVSENRCDVVESKVNSIWTECPFGGQEIVVKPYRDRGWVGYTTKHALFVKRESIDWMNVLLPAQSPVIAE
jgi:hypothetical protein